MAEKPNSSKPVSSLLLSKRFVLPLLAVSGFILQCFVFQSANFLHAKPKIDQKALQKENTTLELHCRPENYERHLANLAKRPDFHCTCKPLPYFKQGCASKVEILSKKPFVVKVHGYFREKSDRIGAFADKVTMRPVMFGDEYGYSWVSPYINSEDGVLTGDMPIVQEILHDLGQSMGLVYPCGGHPGAAIVRYRQGGFVGLHYDAPDLRVEKKFGFWLGAKIFRSSVAWLEDCRHFYPHYNIWRCLYLAWRGKLESSTSWDNYAYGPQVATILMQLSDLTGGETYFPKVNLSVETRKGDILLWQNIDDNWIREPLSMHGGCPVLTSEKLIVVAFMPGRCNTFKELTRRINEPSENF